MTCSTKIFPLSSLLSLLILCSATRSEIIFEQGSLRGFLADTCQGCAYENLISHMTEGIARLNYNIYNPLDIQSNGFGHYVDIPGGIEGDELLATWKTLFGLLVRQEWESADSMLENELSDFPYELVHLQDDELSTEFYLLREQLDANYIDSNVVENILDDEIGSFNHSWGAYIYAVNPVYPRITVQVVHPNDDYIAPYVAIDMFLTLGAGQLFFTTAGREVLWSGVIYTNAASLSDPSRNERHVFQMAHEATTDYFIDEVPGVNPLMIQVHSYDTRNRNFSSAIVTAGYVDRRYSLPIFDWSGVLGGLIDRTEWIVQPENVIGNSHPVTLPEFYGTWSETPLIVYDEEHSPYLIPNPRDLVGYSQSNQLRYREDEMNMCTDHEWLIHIECDELPNCIEDSTEYDFYAGAGFPVSWRNFETIVDYYHPMVENLRASLDTIAVFIDEGLSTAPTNFRVDRVIENRISLTWDRGGDPYFESYRIYYDTASGISTQSPCITADELANLCWQLTDRAAILNLLYDQDYYFALSARDQFGYESDLTPVVMAHTENTPRLLTPVGGELWDYRIPNLVQWTGDGYEEGVWIDVNRDYPYGEWDVLAGDLADDGQEMVVVGNPLSEHCRIRVRTEDMQISAISPGDFSIISVLGYLQIKLVELPGDPIYFWNAGSLECPDNAELTIQLSNPGYAPIIVAAPALVFGDHFSLENECLTERILPPLTTDSCSLSVSFTETSYGIYRDTLQILTDAINAQNNLLSLPLVAERTITVPAPDIVLQLEGTAIRISWDPVTESIQGCPIAATYRVWYYQDEWANRYHLGDITDTTYVHEGILNLASKLFYEVHIVNIE